MLCLIGSIRRRTLQNLAESQAGGTKLSYRTVKKMCELYPRGNLTVIGEIGGLIPAFLRHRW